MCGESRTHGLEKAVEGYSAAATLRKELSDGQTKEIYLRV